MLKFIQNIWFLFHVVEVLNLTAKVQGYNLDILEDDALLNEIFGTEDEYFGSTCPMNEKGLTCSDRGNCDEQSAQCACFEGYEGDSCEICKSCTCSSWAECVKCQAFSFHSDLQDSGISDCQAACQGMNVKSNNVAAPKGATECTVAFENCEAPFHVDLGENAISPGKLTCKGAQSLELVEGSYQGQLKNCKAGLLPHGFGVLEYKNTDDQRAKYTGHFQCGHLQGKGHLLYTDGTQYTGFFKKGFKEGPGKITYVTGDQYDGQWLEDKKQGEGVYWWKETNITYVGNFESGRLEGSGELYIEAEIVPMFSGTFANNARVQGQERFPNGNYYNGNYAGNQFHGEGKLREYCGNSFSGNFENGLFNEGKYTWAKDSSYTSYDGTFANGLPNGVGILNDKSGESQLGQFELGIMMSNAPIKQGY